jgi:hypothetical protein
VGPSLSRMFSRMQKPSRPEPHAGHRALSCLSRSPAPPASKAPLQCNRISESTLRCIDGRNRPRCGWRQRTAEVQKWPTILMNPAGVWRCTRLTLRHAVAREQSVLVVCHAKPRRWPTAVVITMAERVRVQRLLRVWNAAASRIGNMASIRARRKRIVPELGAHYVSCANFWLNCSNAAVMVRRAWPRRYPDARLGIRLAVRHRLLAALPAPNFPRLRAAF